MPLRFSNSEKWNDIWFYRLSPVSKLLFIYICDNCDVAGFLEINDIRIANNIGILPDQVRQSLSELDKSVVFLDGFIWVKKFIQHQKNTPLNLKNKAHKGILAILRAQRKRFSSNKNFCSFLADLAENERGFVGALKPLRRGTGIGIGNNINKTSLLGGLGDKKISIPKELLQIPNFESKWSEWILYRKEKRKPVSVRAAEKQFQDLMKMADPCDAIDFSISKDYQGIFERSQNYNGNKNGKQSSYERRLNFSEAEIGKSLGDLKAKIITDYELQ